MSKQRWAAATAIVGLVSAWALVTCLPASALGQQSPFAGQDVPGNPVTFSINGPAQRLEMVVATSRILTLEYKIPRLLVNNPEVVRATPISPNQIQLSALHPGVTQLNVWDENKNLYSVDVVVTPDGRQLQMLIQSEFPDANVRVRPLASSVYLSGYVPSPGMVQSIIRIAEDYYPNVVNNLTVGGVQQILLKTKVMEVSRTKLRQFGFDWAYLDGQDFVFQSVSGLVAGGGAVNEALATGQDTIRFGIVDGDRAFYGFLDALRQNDLIKVMAEPQLTTVSGRPASFNSGGEFPIIVPQSLGTVSIEYRQYGTRVDFVPIVLGNGNIRLEVRPQVSEIDPSRSVVINSVSVPALRTRWVDTAVEMKAGQTLALAGLIQRRTESQNRGLPWLADIPWFGTPFRRVQETTNEVELLIMVTPEFIEASDPEELPQCGPGETTTEPCDTELYFRGYLEVPKCCDGSGCPECQGGLPGNMGPTMGPNMVPTEVLSPDQVYPHGHPATGGEVLDRAARRPSTRPAPAQTKQASGPVRARIQAESRQPAMIGPVGYESLK
jgi:pilus assembly protein CpaC